MAEDYYSLDYSYPEDYGTLDYSYPEDYSTLEWAYPDYSTAYTDLLPYEWAYPDYGSFADYGLPSEDIMYGGTLPGYGSEWAYPSGFDASSYVYDTVTGQFLTAEQAAALDPTAWSEYTAGGDYGLGGETAAGQYPTTGAGAEAGAGVDYGLGGETAPGQYPVGAGVSPAGAGGGGFSAAQVAQLLRLMGGGGAAGAGVGGAGAGGGMTTAQMLGLGLTGLTAAMGVAGVAQALMSDDPQTKEVVQRAMGQATPEEKAAFDAALQQAGLPTAQRLLEATPETKAAYTAGLSQLTGPGLQQLALSMMVNPDLLRQTQQLGGAQAGILGALAPSAAGIAAGRLPMLADPEALARINAIYAGKREALGGQLDAALQAALERARQQGFAGGTDVFRQGTPAALLAPALTEVARQQGQLSAEQAAAELGLATQLPKLGADLAAAYTTPLSARLAGTSNLINQLLGVSGALISPEQQAATTGVGLTGALGSLYAPLVQTRPTTQTGATTKPFTLLDAFQPTASLLSGMGGALGALR